MAPLKTSNVESISADGGKSTVYTTVKSAPADWNVVYEQAGVSWGAPTLEPAPAPAPTPAPATVTSSVVYSAGVASTAQAQAMMNEQIRAQQEAAMEQAVRSEVERQRLAAQAAAAASAPASQRTYLDTVEDIGIARTGGRTLDVNGEPLSTVPTTSRVVPWIVGGVLALLMLR
jgi:hypothetical protein